MCGFRRPVARRTSRLDLGKWRHSSKGCQAIATRPTTPELTSVHRECLNRGRIAFAGDARGARRIPDRSCDAYARFSSRVQAALPQRVRASANCGRTGPIDPSRTSARRTEVDRDMKLRGPQAAVRGRKVSSTQSVNVTRGQFADTGPGQTALASCSYTSRALTVPSSAPISASSSWLKWPARSASSTT